MPYINYDNKTYSTPASLMSMFLNGIPRKCLASHSFNMASDTNLFKMPGYLDTLYEKSGLQKHCNAVHFSIVYDSVIGNMFYYRLNHLIDMIIHVKDFFSDHPVGYGIMVCKKSIEMHFVIDCIDVKTGKVEDIGWNEITEFCHWCRTCRRKCHLRLKHPAAVNSKD